VEVSFQKDILKKYTGDLKKTGRSLGFVPTMGALHQGHLDLVYQARKECDIVVVSIFVNPLQFNNQEDLKRYPRQPEADAALLKDAGVDFLFSPRPEDFYTTPSRMILDFGSAGSVLEGAMRPGHFSGVGVVLSRLFHLVQPDKAYFGAKDLQQVAVVRTLVRDLEFPVEIIRCPTRREPNGLAMSSRNQRLSNGGKEIASQLYRALCLAMVTGPGNPVESKTRALNHLSSFPEIKLEYLEWVDANNMEIYPETSSKPEEIALCIAAWVEGIRLIDNMIAEPQIKTGN
jgi:pantoate--beta-alanine ligase